MFRSTFEFPLAIDTQHGRRHGLKPLNGNFFAAFFAHPVAALLKTAQSALHRYRAAAREFDQGCGKLEALIGSRAVTLIAKGGVLQRVAFAHGFRPLVFVGAHFR